MKIIYFANTTWYLYNYCLPFAKAAQQSGCDVLMVSPTGEYSALFEKEGLRFINLEFQRRSINPIKEGIALNRLKKLYTQEKPDIVHHFTLKCNIYGSMATKVASIPKVVNSITGLGHVFSGDQLNRRILRFFVKYLFRRALVDTAILFQNPDDLAEFIKEGLVTEEQSTLIRSSGVDLEKFKFHPEPEGIPLVLFAGRLIFDKGILEFIEAARLLKSKDVKARFIIVGRPDPENMTSIPNKFLNSWKEEGIIEYWGWQKDMSPIYQQTHIMCLPTYYREGIPKTLIEASASGRPIVTTDTQGCREVVQDNRNGLLIPTHSIQKLAEALQQLIENNEMRQKMGIEGRLIAEENFGLQDVINSVMKIYGIEQSRC